MKRAPVTVNPRPSLYQQLLAAGVNVDAPTETPALAEGAGPSAPPPERKPEKP